MKYVTAALITVVVGFIAASTLGNFMNWPDAGAVFAVAAMGVCIMVNQDRRHG